ncbi:hypothetical protein AMTRI_Chr02g260280 [Amborella trichopoda]|uniref:Cytochrome P450 n=1 Tax=Amborella trichopoda TaxID=13333 RepID=W1PRU6_AMBTC|nr:cytochrome P450 714C2 [Amborella trichopoda]ERN12727.1 hypothetical protein AMTR_s00043p00089500 [Amborella trichopoda]|eukprot:XP_006851146.3 cytochrome P450 714C2 [Amborella trichopoda]
MELLLQILLSLVLVSFSSLIMCVAHNLWLRPKRIRETLSKQGIRGPRSPSFLHGNLKEMKQMKFVETDEEEQSPHDYVPRLFPYFHQWKKTYGSTFTYSSGTTVFLYVGDPDMIKEMSMCTSMELGKPRAWGKHRAALFGKGILMANGENWRRQRKIIAQELYMDKVKSMIGLMVECGISMLEGWERRVERAGGVGALRVDEDLRNFSADVFSKTCFGSSYEKGQEIYHRLRCIQRAMAKQGLLVGVPGMRFIPNTINREIWKLRREVRSIILKALKERMAEPKAAAEDDLLKAILENSKAVEAHATPDDINNLIVDNCKNLYFAGHETTASAASWCLLLLAMNPIWQTRVRDEVAEVCKGYLPNIEMLRQMKILTMVLHETMRLYAPAAFMIREAFVDLQFGGIRIPAGTNLWIPVSALHHDTEIWGSDAHIFNPERFANGIIGACKNPYAFHPFGFGSRTCVGQNFAMVELKIVISLIISKFKFSLSQTYCHSPTFQLVVEPANGLQLVMERV